MSEVLGYSRLLEEFHIAPVQPLRVVSTLGTTRQSRVVDGYRVEVYPANYQPDASFDAHMTFALKYEGVNPEVLARLFQVVPEKTITNWVNRERGGQYARRTGFLWEWFTGLTLKGVDSLSGNYVEVVDADLQLAATTSVNNTRWRVRDNMPGTPYFCPLVYRTATVASVEAYDCTKELEKLNVKFGADVLMRSAVWLTIKESRSSFVIEHEERRTDDIKRFASAMERFCGVIPNPLSEEALANLQKEIMGDRTTFTHFGLRQSPVFVGSQVRYENVVHYISPHWDDVRSMLAGVEVFLERTKGASPVLRAAVASFAFVYIHPLSDGNGRTHRFLINDILRRDGAVPDPFILPISATITHSPVERARYDAILDVFSKPLMKQFSRSCEFSRPKRYPDGIESDFEFVGYQDAAPAWRHPDLTVHVEYLGDIVDKTIREEMTNEAQVMRNWDQARIAVKEVVSGPNTDIDSIIRSIQENKGAVSNKLRKRFPIFEDAEIAAEVVSAVASVFERDSKALADRRGEDDLTP